MGTKSHIAYLFGETGLYKSTNNSFPKTHSII
jgi:hypothetical protein